MLRTGTTDERLALLDELFEIASECRGKTDSLCYSVLAEPAMREHYRPWRGFQALAGEPVLEALAEIVLNGPPSEVRAKAGDLMAHIWHPSAIGRLLEQFEEGRETQTVSHSVFRDLGGIGTAAAAKALMWLWGTVYDAEVAGALGMCDSEAAQDFLMRNAREHSDPYVRSVCIAHLKPPVTREKKELLIDRLETGTYHEQFTAALKVREFRAAEAEQALRMLRTVAADKVLVKVIDEALAAMRRH